MEKGDAGKKRLLIHDLDAFTAVGVFEGMSGDIETVASGPAVARCVGCFGCWIKTPGRCVIDDAISDYPAKLGCCEELIIVSRLVYGGFSPDAKAVIDRIIPYILPFFEVVDDRMRHVPRYPNRLAMSCYFYKETNGKAVTIEGKARRSLIEVAAEGAGVSSAAGGAEILTATQHNIVSSDVMGEKVTEAEWAIAERLVAAVAKNLRATEARAFFVGDKMELPEVKF
jgi:multimeric flavodoxin WrbA